MQRTVDPFLIDPVHHPSTFTSWHDVIVSQKPEPVLVSNIDVRITSTVLVIRNEEHIALAEVPTADPVAHFATALKTIATRD